MLYNRLEAVAHVELPCPQAAFGRVLIRLFEAARPISKARLRPPNWAGGSTDGRLDIMRKYEPRLAEVLAGEAWRKIGDASKDTHTDLRWVGEICRGLPERFVSPKAVERRVFGLLYKALAFRSYAQENASQTLRYAARAFAQDRGLWSITIRSFVKLLASRSL